MVAVRLLLIGIVVVLGTLSSAKGRMVDGNVGVQVITTHNLEVTTHVRTVASGRCTHGDYSLRTTRDRFGAPLIIVHESGSGSLTPTSTTSATPTPSPRPERTGDLGIKEVQGVVYDSSRGRSAPIADATVAYHRSTPFPPGDSGTVVTDAEGRFTFSLFLHDTDTVTVQAEAPGFRPLSFFYRGIDLWFSPAELEFALLPLGGKITVDPSQMTLACEGAFDITITNSGEDTLLIIQLDLHHGYSQGWYGTGFTWDISHIDLPASLPSGASLTIPISYSADSLMPSRLHLTVESTARNEIHLFQTYFGTVDDCHTPTPTATPLPVTCAGDCDGDRMVQIAGLVTCVNLALGLQPVQNCPACDVDLDGRVSIAELIQAVNAALNGCI